MKRTPMTTRSIALSVGAFLFVALAHAGAQAQDDRTPRASAGSAAARTAVLAYGKVEPDAQAVVSRFSLAILSLYPTWSMGYKQGLIDHLRAANPSIRLGLYVVLNEHGDPTKPGDDRELPVAEIERNGWWVRDAGQGRVQWTSEFGAHEVNVTHWAPPNRVGQRWPQWKAKWDTDGLIGPLRGIDYIFIDNVMWRPRYDADLMRTGRNQSRDDPQVQAAFRQGFVDYFAALRSLNPDKRLIGNADNDLGYPEYRGKLDAVFLECQMGKSWSLESRNGWEAMMRRYRTALANTLGKQAVFQACAPGNQPDPALARYGFASALLDDGYYAYTVSSHGVPYWADEFSAPLGNPAEAPPMSPSASGLWMRRYTNGLVLVNPTGSRLSVDVGPGYRHITGDKDPATNDGTPVRVVALPPRSGLLLVRQ